MKIEFEFTRSILIIDNQGNCIFPDPSLMTSRAFKAQIDATRHDAIAIGYQITCTDVVPIFYPSSSPLGLSCLINYFFDNTPPL